MSKLYKRIVRTGIVCGTVLIICQVVLVFLGNILSTDSVISSSTKTLLSSLNQEIVHNIDDRLEIMKNLGERITSDEEFTSYERNGSSMPSQERIRIEASLGSDLSKYYTVGNFADCVIVFDDSTYLGILDTTTQNLFGNALYKYFSGQADEALDSSNFSTGYDNDYTHIYYAQRVNANTVFMVSILRESLNTLFYDSEENASMTIRLVSAYDGILYSNDKNDEIGNSLDSDISQAVSSSDHLSMILKGRVIASNTCLNKWKVITTIPLSELKGEDAVIQTVYLLISIVFIIISVVCVVMFTVSIKKRMKMLEDIEQNLIDYEDIDNLNLN